MKKIITVTVFVLVLILMTGCAKNVSDPENTSADSAMLNIEDVKGDYQGENVNAYIWAHVNEADGSFRFDISIPTGEPFTVDNFEMNVTFDGNKLKYSDCKKVNIFADGDTVETPVYENGEGYFEYDKESETLKWTGAAEEEYREYTFKKQPPVTDIAVQ